MITVLSSDQPSQTGILPALSAAEVHGLYVHIPFCFHKCHYCDFYSITRQTPDRMDRFVDLLLREAAMWPADRVNAQLRTIFFGGGTPSLLPKPAMQRLLAGLKERLDFSQVQEWTIECNPATVDVEYCRMLRQAGVNRLSFGAQSFNPAELKMLERHHDPEDVPRSLAAAREAGFQRLNVDLIFAIPGQSLESWDRSLSAAMALNTQHISAYALTYESNTPLTVRKRMGQVTPAAEELELQMLHHTRARLKTAGFGAYEISNFARVGEGAECRHNLLYWNGGSYIGLGPSAASHVEGTRWKNRGHLGEWEAAISHDELPAADMETLTPAQRAGELAMLQLRLQGGIQRHGFQNLLAIDPFEQFAPILPRLRELGLIEFDQQSIRLSEKGINLADAVAGEFVACTGPVDRQ